MLVPEPGSYYHGYEADEYDVDILMKCSCTAKKPRKCNHEQCLIVEHTGHSSDFTKPFDYMYDPKHVWDEDKNEWKHAQQPRIHVKGFLQKEKPSRTMRGAAVTAFLKRKGVPEHDSLSHRKVNHLIKKVRSALLGHAGPR